MDRNFFTILFLFITVFASPMGFCAIFSEEFSTNFETCTPYIYDTESKIRQIIGWGNSRCNYREITSQGVTDCQFKERHVAEISEAMKQDGRTKPLRVVYEDGEVAIYNTGWRSLDIWKKYLNMKSTCHFVPEEER